MTKKHVDDGPQVNRRHALECMVWAGTGALWGEHDIIDEDRGKAYLERYGKGSKGAGWYSFDDHGVHFVGLVNVVDLQGGGMGNLGTEQLAWLETDLKDKSSSTPIVVFAHIPLQVIYRQWGWGTEDGTRALELLKRFGSVTVLNGHIHQLAQKVEGNKIPSRRSFIGTMRML